MLIRSDVDARSLSLVKAYTSLDGVFTGQHEVLAEIITLFSFNLEANKSDLIPLILMLIVCGTLLEVLLI